ncbi:hypothetical protein LNW71_15710 [Streptomyces sp. RKAG290]|nr:hypothetical protein [Streptomyces sp. RKAG290]
MVLTNKHTRHRLTLHNGAPTQRATEDAAPARTPASLSLTLTRPQLLGVFAGRGLDGIATEGDPQVLATLFSLLAEADTSFPIVTP